MGALPKKEVDIVPLRGGIDRSSTYVSTPPGAAAALQNYEPSMGGGYRRIPGYERVDGRDQPSSARYWLMSVDDGLAVPVDSTITGATSEATAHVVGRTSSDVDVLIVTALSGEFELHESVGATTVSGLPVISGAEHPKDDAEYTYLAAEHYRAQISSAPGEGIIQGIFTHGNLLYVLRGAFGDLTLSRCRLPRVDFPEGWEERDIGYNLFFESGVMEEGEVFDIHEVTGGTSGAVGYTVKFVKQGGSYGEDAFGYFALWGVDGEFIPEEEILIDGVPKAVVLDGSFENGMSGEIYDSDGIPYWRGCGRSVRGNIDGGDAYKTYFVTTSQSDFGVVWEMTPTHTPIPIYMPAPFFFFPGVAAIALYASRLFVACQNGEVYYSAAGNPYSFSFLDGGGVFLVDSMVCGMVERAGNVLSIYTEEKTYGLFGNDPDTWELRLVSESFGAWRNSVAKMGSIYAMERQGIATVDRAEVFGDFESATVSRNIKPILDRYQPTNLVGVQSVKSKNQIRFFFDDGLAVVMAADVLSGDYSHLFSTIKLAHAPTFVYSGEDMLGNDVCYFGDADGFVYQMDRGTSFDGGPIESVFRSPSLHQNTPHTRKAYRRLFAEIEAGNYLEISAKTELSFGAPGTPVSGGDMQVSGGGVLFNESEWNDAYWDAETFASRGVPLTGTGNNISVVMYSNSAITTEHTIQSLEIHYLLRRLRRGQ